MEVYIMCQAGGTKKHLVMVLESAYESRTLQQIGNLVCDSCQVNMEQVTNNLQVVEETIIVDGYGDIKMPVALSEEVNVDLQDVEEIDIVDDYGVNRIPIVISREVD